METDLCSMLLSLNDKLSYIVYIVGHVSSDFDKKGANVGNET